MIDRDPAFWSRIYEHPEVKPHVSLGHEVDIAAIVTNPAIFPIRGKHGGYLFCRLDGLGRIFELHSLFTPEGRGKDALLTAKTAFHAMFENGAEVIVTHEVAGNRRSQPPISFRFEPAGDFAPGLGSSLRTWTLTRARWEASPARRRM